MPKLFSIEPKNSLGIGIVLEMIMSKKDQFEFISSIDPSINQFLRKMELESSFRFVERFEFYQIQKTTVLFDGNGRFIPFETISRMAMADLFLLKQFQEI